MSDLQSNFNEALTSEELISVESGLAEVENSQSINFTYPIYLFESIKKIWEPKYLGPSYSAVEPEWFIGMTHNFVKDISKVDRKLQGRVLQALGVISHAPVDQRGDTIKPLTSNLDGLWR